MRSLRTLRINNNNALAVSAEMVGAAADGFEEGPFLVGAGWVDEMTSTLEELKRARSVGDLDELFELTAEVERLISALVEVEAAD